jgi:hypothetical protein
MPKRLSVAEILSVLESSQFDLLNDTIEDGQVEFKGSPYQLAADFAKCELAKDVSALANSDGGIILIGFRTKKDAETSGEYAEACRPFDLTLVDPDQHRKVLDAWISPPLPSIEIRNYESPSEAGRGVAAILVPPTASGGKPYLVNRIVEPDGKTRGAQFGYYERVQDRIPAVSAEAIRGYIKDGMRFAEIMERLDSIETFWGASVPPAISGISDEDISTRVTGAERVAERASVANIILTATSTEICTFPELFRSRSAPIVKLLENPPLLRENGFGINPGAGTGFAEIVQGHSRRVLARGRSLIELWQDGVLIALGPGDDDLLCWYMRDLRNPKPGLPIRNFALTEVTLNFCTLAAEAFKNAVPTPTHLRFSLVLDNMTEQDIPCRLSPHDDSGPHAGLFARDGGKPAASSTITSRFTAPFVDLDIGSLVYQLLGGLYVEFGFDFDDMPYVQRRSDPPRITADSLFHRG